MTNSHPEEEKAQLHLADARVRFEHQLMRIEKDEAANCQ
jgi:hypothetical protein